MQIHQPSITGSLTLTGSLSIIGLVENESSGLKAVKIDTSSGAFYFGEAGSSVPSGTVSGSIQVDHDATTNYVANEHIDHTSVSITAGDGLSGGGDISSTSTLTLDTSSTHFSTGVSASAAAAGFGAGGGSGTIENNRSGTGYNPGGLGGGGNGDSYNSSSGTVGSSGTVNTGGGAGGARTSNPAFSGGSGVVILKVFTSSYTGTTSGSPTVTTSGDYTIIKFTSSGSYTV